jgi:malonyl-CoA/methylmalonyl-CoA synthetase
MQYNHKTTAWLYWCLFLNRRFRTGDIASLTSTGSYKILGRASMDIIKSSGYKLSSLLIERELLSHPVISDAAVLGLPDEVLGEKVVAVIVTKQGKQEEWEGKLKKDVLQFLESRLARYEIPRDFLVVQEMPRNVMGKVNKKELRKLFSYN